MHIVSVMMIIVLLGVVREGDAPGRNQTVKLLTESPILISTSDHLDPTHSITLSLLPYTFHCISNTAVHPPHPHRPPLLSLNILPPTPPSALGLTFESAKLNPYLS